MAVFLSSWGIAALYGREELAPLAQLASVAFLLNGLATQFRASLNRALRFRSLAITDVAAAAVGLGVGVSTGLAGAGPWALVAQLLGGSFATLVLVVCFGGWLPGLPRRGVPVGGFIRFGWNMVATQMVTYVGNNVDTVVIGVRFGAAQLGIYNRAFQLVMNTANQLRAPITTCRGADPLAAPGRGREVLGLRARRPSGPRLHDRRGARIRHRRRRR